MRKLPAKLWPLLSLAHNAHCSIREFRAELRRQNKDRLKLHADVVLRSVSMPVDMDYYLMKLLSVHEAIGTDPSVYALSFTWTVAGRQMNDAEAMRLIDFLSEHDMLRPDAALVYEACRAGWRQCVRRLVAQGLYQPLAWPGYPDDAPDYERRRAETLLEVIDPSVEDLRIIRQGFPDPGVGVAIIDSAIAAKSSRFLSVVR